MKILRTADARFEQLPDYPFPPHYLNVGDQLRMHFVDTGSSDSHASTVLMLHGEPSWSYLYRHMIPIMADAGHRVIAPDLIGFGRSDKPAATTDYSYARHLRWLQSLIDQLGLDNVVLVIQDWGSLLGLRLLADQPERFRRVFIGNGMLPTGEGSPPLVFRLWQWFARYSPWFPIDRILQMGTGRTLDKGELAAYRAPFPNRRYKAGARVFPRLVPTRFDDPESVANRAAWERLEQFDRPFHTCFSTGDPIMRGFDKVFRRRVTGAADAAHITLRGGHFLQEDSGEEWAEFIVEQLANQAGK